MLKHLHDLRLSPEQLIPQLDDELFSNHDDTELSGDNSFIGHQRAKEALHFGLSVAQPGFNVFALGEHGTGRQTLIREMLAERALKQETPSEWCYINNFEDSHNPKTLYLSPGDGKQLQARINTFVDELLDLFPEVFDNPGYQRQKAAIDREFNLKYDEAIAQVEQAALAHSVVLYEEDGEITFSPVVNGKPLSDKEFSSLDESKRAEFYQLLTDLEKLLSEQLLELPLWKRKSSEQLRQLKRTTIEVSTRPLIKELEREFANNLGVIKYLSQLKSHVVDAVLDILVNDSQERDDKESRKLLVEYFLPNLLVAREPNAGAPVIYEQNPTYQNLFGSIDYSNISGAIYTSYRQIRPGALHKANGGYLLVDVEKLFAQPMVWSRLKLALKTEQISIEPMYAELSQSGVYTLQPAKIPLKVKVVLLGTPDMYYTLQEYDQEFSELFRVLADFDRHITKNDANLRSFAKLMRQRASKQGYPEISKAALKSLTTYALRRAEHQQKLSANIVQVNDLLDEANFIFQQAQSNIAASDTALIDSEENGIIEAEHIEQALRAKEYRTGRMSETWLSEIKEQQVLISTSGTAVGKVNGLTVLEIGDSVFGTPARISATVYAGANGVTDIEREAELGKAIHSKGVLLLTGYLGHKYGQSFPLSISANIAIEQSYGHIDGDSASMAELCALISAITSLPIKQSIAMTGSINQHGEVQSIGGVNEKIEGFFRLCRDKGLTGEQGVIIPKPNTANLVLSQEVVEAVQNNEFHIYSVENIDQTLELIMDVRAGAQNSVGRYPRNSIHALALAKLAQFSDLLAGE